MSTIVVTGATGNIAGRTLSRLLAAGHKVRAIVRNPEKAKALAGVELFTGDFDAPRTVARAFDGADAVFLVVPNGATSAQHVSTALDAARKAGAKHIVRLSAVGADFNAPTINSRLHALSDEELARSGVPYTILKPHFFMQNLAMHQATIASQGAMYAPLGEGRLGMIDSDDIADVAAAVLSAPAAHAGKTYTLTGPASITMHDVAAAFTAALGKPVKYVPVPLSAMDEGMAQWGMSLYARDMMLDYMAAYAANWGDIVTDAVPTLAGHKARSIADFAQSARGMF